ncbi:MAG: hypothetical protein R3B47_17285 [Bacteroidia bacterium]
MYDPGDQVWVAKGTYFPDSLYTGIGLNPRNRTFVMRSGLKIFGGFISGQTSLSQRDYFNNKTILSGDIGVLNDTTDNAFSVVYAWYTDSSAWLDGFIITKGRATDGTPLGYVNGGGINCPDQTSSTGATIRNCTITDNIASSNGGGTISGGTMFRFIIAPFQTTKPMKAQQFFRKPVERHISERVFSENAAGSFGGGVAVRGRAAAL